MTNKQPATIVALLVAIMMAACTGCQDTPTVPRVAITPVWESAPFACRGQLPLSFIYPYAVHGEIIVARGLDSTSRFVAALGIGTASGNQAWCVPRPLVGDAPFLGSLGFSVFLDPVQSAIVRVRSSDGTVDWERRFTSTFASWGVAGYSASDAVAAIVNSDGAGLRFEAAAFSAQDGRLLWSRLDSTEFRFLSRPRGAVVIGDTVFVYGNEWLDRGGIRTRIFLFAYSAASGTPLARFNSGDAASSTVAPPALLGNRFVLGNNEGGLLAMSTRGEVLWRVDGRGIGPGQSPVIRDGIAYAASADGTVRAVDVATGEQRWVTDLRFSLQGVAACGNSVYAQMVTDLWRLDRATGAITGHEADDEGGVRSRFFGPLISTPDAVYAGGRGGRIYRLPC